MKIPLLKRHLDNNTNFNIGDFVKIYEYYNIFDWYSNETYEIINIKNNIIILDRYLPKDRFNVKTNKIYYNKIYIFQKKLVLTHHFLTSIFCLFVILNADNVTVSQHNH